MVNIHVHVLTLYIYLASHKLRKLISISFCRYDYQKLKNENNNLVILSLIKWQSMVMTYDI